jgi:CHRD domain
LRIPEHFVWEARVFNQTFVVGALVAATGLVFAGTGPVSAHSGGQITGLARTAFFAADLNGTNSVPAADPDGRGKALVRIQGKQVCFALSWSNIAAPTAGHIHVGAAGVNGAVVVPFFAGALPTTVSATTGCVLSDSATVDGIRANPAGYYVNLHNVDFPAGAIRGQLRALQQPANLAGMLQAGMLQAGPSRTLTAHLTGAAEVPGPGDADGTSNATVQVGRTQVHFVLTWSAIGPPTAGHIHVGAVGVSGAVVVPFFAAPSGIPSTLTGVAGVAPATTDVTAAIIRTPANYYTNLHNAEFPGGVIRGQLS